MKNVLIVDDETRLLQTIEVGLKSNQDEFEVITACNGKEAVEVLKKHRIDLVVTDLRMPEMDGFELLSFLSNTYPFMPNVVMTAFATPEIEEKLNATGTLKLLEKPLDIEKLAKAINEGLKQDSSEGAIAGFSLANFLQLLAMEKKTCLLNVRDSMVQGYIYLHQGEIHAAVSGSLKGEEAAYQLLARDHVKITFQKLPKRKVQKMIKKSLMSLLMEAMRRKDEKTKSDGAATEVESVAETIEVPEAEKKSELKEMLQTDSTSPVKEENGEQLAPKQEPKIGDIEMGKLEDTLGKMSEIEGFMAAGVFTPNGEMAAQLNNSSLKLAEIGSLANDVLLKAQKATDIMNVGRGTLVHIDAPDAHILARCFNESSDYAQTQAGKAHIHMVVVLKKEGNLAMTKMRLDTIVHEVAEAFR